MEKIKIVELFCGVGGLHWALKETGINFEIIGALEINPTVLETYSCNFPDVNLLRRNIESLTAEEINEMNIDAIVMSPPCQPFCRTGHKQGLLDKRSSPLTNLLKILPQINFKYIFVENVKGFEVSDARTILIEALTTIGFQYQEFLLSPMILGIPNSRLRYYLIGKHSNLRWTFDLKSNQVLDELPINTEDNALLKTAMERQRQRWENYRQLRKSLNFNENLAVISPPLTHALKAWCIDDILEPDECILREHVLTLDKLTKYWNALDLVTPSSTRSCCFTKAYFTYLTGSGSILDCSNNSDIPPTSSSHKISNDSDTVKQTKGKFRYFTPREVCRLMCYPEEFKFPSNHSLKQTYKALGNSVNVNIVAVMFSLLFS